MKIIDMEVGDLSTPEGREEAMKEIRKGLNGMDDKEKVRMAEAALDALEAMAKGMSATDVNLTQAMDRLERVQRIVDELRDKLRSDIPRLGHPMATMHYGSWHGMLVIAGGCLHTVTSGMREHLRLPPREEEETEPVPSEGQPS